MKIELSKDQLAIVIRSLYAEASRTFNSAYKKEKELWIYSMFMVQIQKWMNNIAVWMMN